MSEYAAHRTAYLMLDELTGDPALARRLPSHLAWQYHALPLAEENGGVTVVMADPEDVEARQAVIAALGPTSCLVKGSPLTIDARLAEIWGDDARRLQLGVCGFPDPPEGEQWAYVQALCTLLGGQMSLLASGHGAEALDRDGGFAASDLIVFGRRHHPLIRRILSGPSGEQWFASRGKDVPLGILVAHRPRWPLARILLVLCGESADSAALAWTLRLARPSGAVVTVLAVVPAAPAMYRGLSRMEQGVAGLLDSNTTLGRQIHHVVRRLAESKVDGTLRLRPGVPDWQICREAVEGSHDLVIMAACPNRWWLRKLRGDPMNSVLSCLDRPLLLVEPAAESRGAGSTAL